MRRFTSNIVGTSVLAIALSMVLVGAVWAGTSALQSTDPDPTDDTVVTTSTTLDESQENTDESENTGTDSTAQLSIEELTALVTALTARVDADTERINALIDAAKITTENVEKVNTELTEVLKKIERLDSRIDNVGADVALALEKVGKAADDIDVIKKQVSQLDENGVYLGKITPEQLSRKLAPTDLTGNWPLERTTGDLDSGRLKVSGSGCWPDNRYNVVLSTDPFGRVVCVKIAK